MRRRHQKRPPAAAKAKAGGKGPGPLVRRQGRRVQTGPALFKAAGAVQRLPKQVAAVPAPPPGRVDFQPLDPYPLRLRAQQAAAHRLFFFI